MRPITDRLSPVIRALVILDTVLFAFYAVVREARSFFTEHLALGPAFLQGEVWQPLTALFVHPDDFLGFAFNVLGLWFVGATIEKSLGTRRFLALFVLAGAGANVLKLLIATQAGTPAMFYGAGTAVLALFVAFGTIFDRAPARVLGGLVLEARTLTLILVGFALLADVTRGTSRGSMAELAGDLFAVLLGYVMAGGRGEFVRTFLARMRGKRARRRYTVLEGGRGRDKAPLN